MEKKTHNIQLGGGLMLPLLALFVALKLTGHVDWSWLWVLAPLWLPTAIVLGIVAACFLGAFLFLVVGGIVIAILDRR